MHTHLKSAVSAIALGLMAPLAAAELLIAPTRVVLENGERSAEVVLVNKGNEEGAYRISLENRRMTLEGALEEVETAEEGELFASEIVRYSPRRALLPAGGRQTIRVAARTNNLEPGEYRTHLKVMGAPTSAGRTLTEATGESDGNITIELIAINSLTIPVIVRVGQLDAEVVIDGAETLSTEIEGDDGEITTQRTFIAHLTRTGDRSTYGDIQLFVEGEPEPVFFARGIAVYTPNTKRQIRLNIPDEIMQKIEGKEIRIEYISSDPENPATLAELNTTLS